MVSSSVVHRSLIDGSTTHSEVLFLIYVECARDDNQRFAANISISTIITTTYLVQRIDNDEFASSNSFPIVR